MSAEIVTIGQLRRRRERLAFMERAEPARREASQRLARLLDGIPPYGGDAA